MTTRSRTPGPQSAPAVNYRDKTKQVLAQRQQEAAERGKPFRFWLDKGQSAKIIILDTAFSTAPHVYEHTIPGPGGDFKKSKREIVAPDIEHDPLEDVLGKKAAWMGLFTILDLRPYTKDDKTYEFTKKILAVKQSYLESFYKYEDFAMKKYGTCRGLVLNLERDTDQMSANIGTIMPFENDQGDLVNFDLLSEATLIQRYSNKEIKNQQGQVIKPAGDMIRVVDPKILTARKTSEELVLLYGGRLPAGSMADVNSSWDESPQAPSQKSSAALDDDLDTPDDIPF